VKSVPKQFVVQEHRRGEDVHWDMMLEDEGSLSTYRFPLPPKEITASPVIVEKIFDHDPKFLAYEGPVNKGMGTVHIVDSGSFQMIEKTEIMVRVRMEGKILCGEFVFEHIERDQWQFLRLSVKEY
jgi:hypothetical protein